MVKITKPRGTKSLAVMCARLAQNKIADNIVLMDLTKIETSPADYFIVCSCDSDTQVRAVTDEIMRKSKNFDIDKPHVEGLDNASWVLIDYFDVVAHIMVKETRNFYQLERLWGDAKFMTLDDEGKVKKISIKDIQFD